MKRKYMAVLLAAALLLTAPLAALVAEGEAETPAGPFEVGQMVKEAPVQTLDGKTADLGKLGKKTLIVFMNTACSACQQEMGEMQKLWLRNKDKFDYAAISVDLNGKKTVPGFVETSRSKATFYLDSTFETTEKFGFSYTPATVVIGADGKLLYKKGGWMKSQAKKTIADLEKVLL